MHFLFLPFVVNKDYHQKNAWQAACSPPDPAVLVPSERSETNPSTDRRLLHTFLSVGLQTEAHPTYMGYRHLIFCLRRRCDA